MIRGDNFEGNLEVGRRVHCILYGGQDGIIFKINGEQRPESIESLGGGCVVMGGSASFDIVFEDHISNIPEAILRGVQWYILEGRATAEEIDEALKNAVDEKVKQEEEKAKRAAAREEARQEVRAKNPHLDPVDPKAYDSLVKGSRNLKRELAAAFPSVKFSVRSESYSGGCSINVSWIEEGIEEERVKAIASKYQEGSFDGMNDIYEHNKDNVWPDVFGGAKFVFCQPKDW